MTANRAATALMDFLCDSRTVGHDRTRGRLGRATRRAVLHIADPDVMTTLDGTPLVLPLSHDLPINRAHFPDYSANLGHTAAAIARHRRLDRPVSVIDIGANIGDSVAIVRSATDAEFLCVEGDTTFLPYLKRNTTGLPVEIAENYLQSADVSLAGTSVVRHSGTARLAERGGANATTRSAADVATIGEILDRHPSFTSADLVKIDTDGHDAGIIRAMASWLVDARPIVFFELDPRLTESVGGGRVEVVFETLYACGYRTLLAYNNVGRALGSHALDDPDLPACVTRLGTGTHPPYWDVVVTNPADQGVLTLLDPPSHPDA